MDLNGILSSFDLPIEAHEALTGIAANMQQKDLGKGVSTFSGHDNGTAYRFFTHVVYNPERSKGKRYEEYDEIEMIEWYNDKYNHPTEPVRFLPPEMLMFEREDIYKKDKEGKDKLVGVRIGEAIAGKLLDSYKRFKEGRSAPGTALNKWGVLSDAQVATLAAKFVFSVEQFAAMPDGKVVGVFPEEFIEAWKRAKQFVNQKEDRDLTDKQSETIDLQAKQIAELMEKVNALSAAKGKEAKAQTTGKQKTKPAATKAPVKKAAAKEAKAPKDNGTEVEKTDINNQIKELEKL